MKKLLVATALLSSALAWCGESANTPVADQQRTATPTRKRPASARPQQPVETGKEKAARLARKGFRKAGRGCSRCLHQFGRFCGWLGNKSEAGSENLAAACQEPQKDE